MVIWGEAGYRLPPVWSPLYDRDEASQGGAVKRVSPPL